jgi:hypothetical protein
MSEVPLWTLSSDADAATSDLGQCTVVRGFQVDKNRGKGLFYSFANTTTSLRRGKSDYTYGH